MIVYVVFHNDIEDSKWVRGVYSTRELAEAKRDSPEPCLTHPNCGDRHASPFDCRYAEDHFTRGGKVESICCDVDEWTLDDK